MVGQEKDLHGYPQEGNSFGIPDPHPFQEQQRSFKRGSTSFALNLPWHVLPPSFKFIYFIFKQIATKGMEKLK